MFRRVAPHRRHLWTRLRRRGEPRDVERRDVLCDVVPQPPAAADSPPASHHSSLVSVGCAPPPISSTHVDAVVGSPSAVTSLSQPKIIREFRVNLQTDDDDDQSDSSDAASSSSSSLSSESDEYLTRPLQQIAARNRREGRQGDDFLGTESFFPPSFNVPNVDTVPTVDVHTDDKVHNVEGDVRRRVAAPPAAGMHTGVPLGRGAASDSRPPPPDLQTIPSSADEDLSWDALKETGMYIASGVAEWFSTMMAPPAQRSFERGTSPLHGAALESKVAKHSPLLGMHTASLGAPPPTMPTPNSSIAAFPSTPNSPKLPPPGDPLTSLFTVLSTSVAFAARHFTCGGSPLVEDEVDCRSQYSDDVSVPGGHLSAPAPNGTFALQLPDPHVKDVLDDTWSYVYHSHVEISFHKAFDMGRVVNVFIVAGDIKFRIPGFRIDRVKVPIRANWRVMVLYIATVHAADSRLRKWYSLDIPLGSLGEDIYNRPIALVECPDPGPFGSMDGVALCDIRDCDEVGSAFHTLRYRAEQPPSVPRIVMTIRRQLQGLTYHTHVPEFVSTHTAASGSYKIYTGLFCDEVDAALACEFASAPDQLAVVDSVVYEKPGCYTINQSFSVLIFFGFIEGNEDRQLLVFEGGSIQPARDWFTGTGKNVQWINVQSREELLTQESASAPKYEQADFSACVLPWEATADITKANEFAMFQAAVAERETIDWFASLQLPTPVPSYSSYLEVPHFFRTSPSSLPVEMNFVRDPQRRRMFRFLPVERSPSNLWNERPSAVQPRSAGQ